MDCFYFKIVLNTVGRSGFTTKLNALDFEEGHETLLIKTNAHINTAYVSTVHANQYLIKKSLIIDVASGLLALAGESTSKKIQNV